MIEYIFGACAIIVLLRAILGPTLADRMMSVDILTNIAVLFMIIYAINIDSALYLDIALLIALISFVGVLAIARWVRK